MNIRTKYPRLTPFRALELLEKVCRAQEADDSIKRYTLSEVKEALDSHIRAELTKRRK